MWNYGNATQQPYYSPNRYQSPVNYSSTAIPIDSLDWPFLDNIDPGLLTTKKYRHILKEVSQKFSRTTISKLGPPHRTIKLFQILQAVISTLSHKYEKSKDLIDELQQKNRILQHNLTSANKNPRIIKKVVGNKCPVCQKDFDTLTTLDLHIFTKHQEVSTLWQAIRTPQPPGAFAFPWQKSYSITSTMYPQTTQTSQNQVNMNLIEDMKKNLTVEQKEAEREMKEWIDKKMNKLESKMDSLQKTVKKEDLSSTESSDERIIRRSHHKKKESPKVDDSNKKKINTEHPFNPPKKADQISPQKQTFETPKKSPTKSHSRRHKKTDKPKQKEQQSQPVISPTKIENPAVNQGQIQLEKPSNSGSVEQLDQTSNFNFLSPAPKTAISGSDAEYESAPIQIENNIQNSNGIEKVESEGGVPKMAQNDDVNDSQASSSSPIQQINQDSFRQPPYENEDDVQHEEEELNDQNRIESLSEGEICDGGNFVTSWVRPQSDNDNVNENYNDNYDDYNRQNEYNEDECVKSEGSDIYSKQLDKYNTSDLYRATPPPGKSLIKHSSSAGPEKPARKQERGEEEEKSYDEFVISTKKSSSNKLNNLNDLKEGEYEYSNYSNAEPKFPSGFNKASSSNSDHQIHHDDQFVLNHQEDDFHYDYDDNYDKEDFEQNEGTFGGTFGDDVNDVYGDEGENYQGQYYEEDLKDGFDQNYEEEFFENESGLIDGTFDIDSPPPADLPEFSDSAPAKKGGISRRQNRYDSPSNKVKSKFPSEKFMKEAYSKSSRQKEDINQMYNDIINSNSDNY
ncbi:hypothetical protein M9Y10_039658 [Tritrichomonas musculus]|uniref:C2H2-type domain-containing protein n=1 Tax=Tritrichomonas musculus TaxID=1915356 RepID=A0ABR2GQV4_9EUKA